MAGVAVIDASYELPLPFMHPAFTLKAFELTSQNSFVECVSWPSHSGILKAFDASQI